LVRALQWPEVKIQANHARVAARANEIGRTIGHASFDDAASSNALGVGIEPPRCAFSMGWIERQSVEVGLVEVRYLWLLEATQIGREKAAEDRFPSSIRAGLQVQRQGLRRCA
jgi:hypothetical protein